MKRIESLLNIAGMKFEF